MTCTRPDLVTTQRADGKWLCRCLGCGDGAGPSFHKPAIEDWRKAHVRNASGPLREPGGLR
ncbi:MAG TPA: hypothetical protein VFJ21_09520 [Mycobacteriales bacterium]|nr:hypothetical protein [Mycobacteriales bacterium]